MRSRVCSTKHCFSHHLLDLTRATSKVLPVCGGGGVRAERAERRRDASARSAGFKEKERSPRSLVMIHCPIVLL
jgi:hypothetical protein